MDSVAFYFDLNEDCDAGETCNFAVQRKAIRDSSDPLDVSEKRFIYLFRVSKFAFKSILDEIAPILKQSSYKNAIPPILKLAATLRFVAQGSYQLSVGQDFLIAMAQPTVSVVLAEVLLCLETHLCPKYISFEMDESARRKEKKYFFQKFGFPGVIGCIDGTHINIVRPSKNEHHFYNRRGTHSLNVMMICNHRLEILAVDSSYGGAAHDALVWSLSNEKHYMQSINNDGDTNCWLLGDSGYPLQPWLMTPYSQPGEGTSQAKYNILHSKCRSTIERCFGVLKGRFRCLLQARELDYKPEKAAQIVNVCVMLHNVCIKHNVDFDESLFTWEEDSSLIVNEINRENVGEARIIRDNIRDNLL